jgi:hypothetical protein
VAAATDALEKTALRKVLVPGVILALATHPHVAHLEAESQAFAGLSDLSIFVTEVVVLGVLISSATKPIYYVYEGFLLPWLTWPARKWNESRCARLKARLGKLYETADGSASGVRPENQHKAELLYEQLRDYPLIGGADEPKYTVERPTRLGNIIATYELYPQTRYGVDGVTFWFHLLYLAPEDARRDFQDGERFAESCVLGSAAGILLALAGGCLVTGRLLAPHLPQSALIDVSVATVVGWLQLLTGALIAIFFYSMSLPAHRELGQTFRALTDLAIPGFEKWLSKFSRTRLTASDDVARYLDDLEESETPKVAKTKRKRRR